MATSPSFWGWEVATRRPKRWVILAFRVTAASMSWARSPSGLGKRANMVLPQQEQDVVALFHQLLVLKVFRGYKIYATSQNETYDSLFAFDYGAEKLRFSVSDNPLGVNERLLDHGETDPKVLEYKYDFDGLVEDFENNSKSAQHIDQVVCWSVGKEYKDSFYLKPLLIGDEGGERQFFGSTHQVFSESSGQMHFEVVVLSDLLKYLLDPQREEARQRVHYADS